MRRLSRVCGFAACAGLLALSACRSNESSAGPEKSSATASAAADPSAPSAGAQARTIEVAVSDKGYQPASAPAKAGEKLVLAFTRTSPSDCVSQVIVDGKTTDLPLNKRVEIPTTMPATGDLVFTCGMKMFEGRVVVATP